MFINKELCEEAKSDNDAFYCFLHAQRSGGRNFRSSFLERVFGKGRIYHPRLVEKFVQWKNIEERDVEGFAAYAGHHNFMIKDWRRPVYFITIVRDPIRRVASLQRYIQGNVEHRFHDISFLELDRFYSEGVNINPSYFSNIQCRRCCGAPKFELAVDNIKKYFLGVGTTEALQEFSDCLSEALGFEKSKVRDPETPQKRGDLTSEIIEEGEVNDYKLWNWARDQLP